MERPSLDKKMYKNYYDDCAETENNSKREYCIYKKNRFYRKQKCPVHVCVVCVTVCHTSKAIFVVVDAPEFQFPTFSTPKILVSDDRKFRKFLLKQCPSFLK